MCEHVGLRDIKRLSLDAAEHSARRKREKPRRGNDSTAPRSRSVFVGERTPCSRRGAVKSWPAGCPRHLEQFAHCLHSRHRHRSSRSAFLLEAKSPPLFARDVVTGPPLSLRPSSPRTGETRAIAAKLASRSVCCRWSHRLPARVRPSRCRSLSGCYTHPRTSTRPPPEPLTHFSPPGVFE